MKTKELKQALRNGRYAWPGGYPTYFLVDDAEAICHDCVRDNFREILDAIKCDLRNGWKVEAHGVNWEDACLTCAHCGAFIESAYGEREGGEE